MASPKQPVDTQSKQLHFGPYTLQTCPNNHFRTAVSLPEPQQCIIDNLWHFRNHKSFPDILRILSGHFAFLNSSQAHASTSSVELQPKSVSFLETQVKQLKISLAEKEKTSQSCSEQLTILATKILVDERKQRESLWESYPETLHPLKSHILKLVLKDRLAEHLALQECFRKICTRPVPLYDGLTFSLITHDSIKFPKMSFTYVSAVINLNKWTDKNVLGLNLSVDNLTKFGMISVLYVFDNSYPDHRRFLKDRQLRCICDKLATGGRMMNGYARLDFVSIPPSFNCQYPDDLRQEILVMGVSTGKPWIHYNWHNLPITSDEAVPVLDQMLNFRSMRIAKSESCSFGGIHRLVAESRNTKIFWNSCSPAHFYVPFQSLFPEDPDSVHYFSSPSISALINVHGEFPLMTDNFGDPDDDLDDEYGNIANALDA